MCGRYSQDVSWAQVHAFSKGLSLQTPDADPEPAYNIAPTQAAWLLVADEEQGARAAQMRWGLIPFWAKDTRIGYSTINARLETAASKPAFREAWKRRRCLVIASGYYEWRDEAGARQPYWIHPADVPLMLFAGLWEHNDQVAETPLLSFSILTTAAQGEVSALHDRMPLSLGPEVLSDWLHIDAAGATEIADAARARAVEFHKVDRAVGNVRNQGPELIKPLQDS